jgi:hypothetical protein
MRNDRCHCQHLVSGVLRPAPLCCCIQNLVPGLKGTVGTVFVLEDLRLWL